MKSIKITRALLIISGVLFAVITMYAAKMMLWGDRVFTAESLALAWATFLVVAVISIFAFFMAVCSFIKGCESG